MGESSRPEAFRRDNPDAAREAVERDMRNSTKVLTGIAGRVGFATAAEIDRVDADCDTIVFQYGKRDDLTEEAARKAGEAWRKVIARYPRSIYVLVMPGYDDDPRELWEFPDVCEYVCLWARFAGLDDPLAALDAFSAGPFALGIARESEAAQRLIGGSMSLLSGSGVFGEELRKFTLRRIIPTANN
jgi:hypothetical protein